MNVDMVMFARNAVGTSADSVNNLLFPSQDFSYWPGTAVALGNGVKIRPALLPGVPASAVVPYYSQETFHLTPDFFGGGTTGAPANVYTLYNNGTCPGICFGTLADTTATAPFPVAMLANISDNFAFGGLYPPCCSTVSVATGAHVLPTGYVSHVSDW